MRLSIQRYSLKRRRPKEEIRWSLVFWSLVIPFQTFFSSFKGSMSNAHTQMQPGGGG